MKKLFYPLMLALAFSSYARQKTTPHAQAYDPKIPSRSSISLSTERPPVVTLDANGKVIKNEEQASPLPVDTSDAYFKLLERNRKLHPRTPGKNAMTPRPVLK